MAENLKSILRPVGIIVAGTTRDLALRAMANALNAASSGDPDGVARGDYFRRKAGLQWSDLTGGRRAA